MAGQNLAFQEVWLGLEKELELGCGKHEDTLGAGVSCMAGESAWWCGLRGAAGRRKVKDARDRQEAESGSGGSPAEGQARDQASATFAWPSLGQAPSVGW